jgi:hypothetical protein
MMKKSHFDQQNWMLSIVAAVVVDLLLEMVVLRKILVMEVDWMKAAVAVVAMKRRTAAVSSEREVVVAEIGMNWPDIRRKVKVAAADVVVHFDFVDEAPDEERNPLKF